jgi:4-oxalocrotonate tautomerase
MPIINVAVTGKPDPNLSARLAAEISELTKTHLRKDPTVTAIAVSYVDPQHWLRAADRSPSMARTASGST